MIIVHLPSPKVAQVYRTSFLYEGPIDDEVAQAMMRCDPEGPIMMYVSKLVPNPESTRFYAFGRVFSGTISTGSKVRILGPNFKFGKNEDLYEKNVQKVVIWMGKKIEEVTSIPCGNTCALIGIDQCLVKSGTVTDHPAAFTIKSMKYSVSPVVRVAIRPVNPMDLPKLVEGLQKLAKYDNLVQVTSTETEQVIAGSGELHLEICINDLQKYFTNNIQIIKSDPVVPYKETVTIESPKECVSKSANGHNRIHCTAEPMHEELVKNIELDIVKLSTKVELSKVYRQLIDDYSWEQHDAKKIWAFGMESLNTNVLVDQTSSVQYLNEIRDHCESSFHSVVNSGVLCEESLRGVRFNIKDANLHSDAVHRGGGNIIPCAKRVYYASQLTAEPRFLEPVYLVDISTPSEVVSNIYQCFSQKRGVIFSDENVYGTPLHNLKAYLPVSESFGFTEYLRSATSGKAFPQCVFDHWELIKDDPLDKKSKAYDILMKIRKRKGLKMELPNLSDYLDKF